MSSNRPGFSEPPPPRIGFAFEDDDGSASAPRNPALAGATSSFPSLFSGANAHQSSNQVSAPMAFGGGSWEDGPPVAPRAAGAPSPLARVESLSSVEKRASVERCRVSDDSSSHEKRCSDLGRSIFVPERRRVAPHGDSGRNVFVPERRSSPRSRSPPRRPGSRGRSVEERHSRGRSHDDRDRGRGHEDRDRGREVAKALAEVQEIVDDHLIVVKLQDRASRTALVCVEDLFVPNPRGNPYGLPVRYVDLKEELGPLRKALAVGTKVLLNGRGVRKSFVDVLASLVWPEIAQKPPDTRFLLSTREREKILARFDYDVKNGLREDDGRCVKVALVGVIENEERALVSHIVDDDYGKIEMKIGRRLSLITLFHREDVYLKDGKRAVEHDFFKDKPLDQMVSVGQEVNLIARSICSSGNTILNPAKIPLQAIVVSLNPSHIPSTAPQPSRYEGGPGTITSKSRSYVYFDKTLNQNLNRKLVTFIDKTKDSFPGLDPACLKIASTPEHSSRASSVPTAQPVLTNEIEQSKSEPMEEMLPALHGTLAKVKELLSDKTGVLEGLGGQWLCFFTSDHVLRLIKQQGLSLKDHMPPDTQVLVNATLIEVKHPIQYLASAVWLARDFPGRDTAMDAAEDPSLQISQTLLQKYYDFNEISKDKAGNAQPLQETSSSKTTGSQEPKYLERRRGRVYKILDSNFAIAQVDNDDSKLALFDTCDFWVNPGRTLDQDGRTFFDVLKEGDEIAINAALMDSEERIQYLASGAWLWKNKINWSGPGLIVKENLLPEKINIFKQVLASAKGILPPPTTRRDRASSRNPSNRSSRERGHNEYAQPLVTMTKNQFCTIHMLFERFETNAHHDAAMCGLLKIDNNQFAFFDVNNCLGSLVSIGYRTKANLHRLQRDDVVGRVTHVALTLNHSGVANFVADEVSEEVAKMKIDESLRLLNKVVKCLGPNHDCFKNPERVKLRVVRVDNLKVEKDQEESSQKAILKAVLDDKAAFLVSENKGSEWIYMELEDVNTPHTWSMINLVTYLNKSDTWVRYRADTTSERLEDGRRVLLAKDRGIELSGFSFKPSEVKSPNFNKVSRFNDACRLLGRKDISIRTKEIFLENYDKKPLVKRRGVVKHILNENFGLIRGVEADDVSHPEEKFVLFDVFDLMVTEQKSAAEAKIPIQQVVKEGDTVYFNACVIDRTSSIPSLATYVWLQPNLSLPGLTVSTLQKDKVNIYREVAKSCSDRLAAESKEQNTASETAVVEAQLTDERCVGRLYTEKDHNFAILRLASGKKALVNQSRIWIKDKPKHGDWHALHLKYFRALHVFARKVENFHSFDYQVIYCHAGIRRDASTSKFPYSPTMEKWSKPLWLQKRLDGELDLYRLLHGQ